ncbi:MAG: pentapeptide repeat-containing protein [Chlorobiales bacterium]|nr:pentapeptide repeat-containing protein [Chlorobiales bacterium]
MTTKTHAKHTKKGLIFVIWKNFREEWYIWLLILVLLSTTFYFSNQITALLDNSGFLKTLDSLSKLGIILAVIAFLRGIPKWKEQVEEEAKKRRFEYWKAVDAAYTARENSRDGRFFSHALRIALESLAQEKDIHGKPFEIGPFDVDHADLKGINLGNSHLCVAGFRDTNLSEANFSHTILDKAYFQRARLFGVDFQNAKFLNTIVFRHALYDDATRFPEGFDPVIAHAYRIAPKADLRGAMLFKAMLWDSQLEGANLSEANLELAILGGNLCCANFQNANLQGVKAGQSNFEQANFQHTSLCEAGFSFSNLQHADLRDADLQDAVLEHTDLYGADLRGARNIRVDQIRLAQNWEYARYDNDFREKLELLQ